MMDEETLIEQELSDDEIAEDIERKLAEEEENEDI